MIWNDVKIRTWASTGGVTPYDASLVNPASIDLRLGSSIRIPLQRWHYGGYGRSVGKQTPADELWQPAIEFDCYTLPPGAFVLCHSLEYTTLPSTACAMLFSKSSTGRIGLEHVHAGLGDCSFSGQWTWELCNIAPWPIELVAGQAYMQLVLMDMVAAPERDYAQTGRYQGQRGPEAHRPDTQRCETPLAPTRGMEPDNA
jgi:deoxycytidine triphosphate deaminase